MPPRVTISDLTGLKPKYANFVIEYTKDFSVRRAAEASGWEPDSGYAILKRPEVAEAIDRILESRLETSHIDAEWALMEAVDNHKIARQMGNITASNTALNLIMKHKFVDAQAADKVELTSEREVMERLLRGRNRLSQRDRDDDEPSFF